eukprot:scaffold87868_cov89-Phaeocystis_antarctica.AAC.2
MRRMSMTLDVSKLTGWLNALAFCRVENRAYAMRGEVRAGRREGVGRRLRKRHARGGPDRRLGGHTGHARSARRTCRTCS